MKQKPYISTQISVLTRDKRAKICTKIQAKTTVYWYTNKIYGRKYARKLRQRRHYISSQISVTRDIRAKICTKIDVKNEAEAGCRG